MKKELSAGGIITKKENDQLLVLLVEHKDKTYVFPKGHVETGETLKQAAKREIQEEVGLTDIEIGEKLGIVTRHSIKPNGQRVDKNIVLFKVKINNFNHKKKTDEVYDWFTPQEALKKLRYKEDVDFLKKIIKKI